MHAIEGPNEAEVLVHGAWILNCEFYSQGRFLDTLKRSRVFAVSFLVCFLLPMLLQCIVVVYWSSFYLLFLQCVRLCLAQRTFFAVAGMSLCVLRCLSCVCRCLCSRLFTLDVRWLFAVGCTVVRMIMFVVSDFAFVH